jgi:hypothetical protein
MPALGRSALVGISSTLLTSLHERDRVRVGVAVTGHLVRGLRL